VPQTVPDVERLAAPATTVLADAAPDEERI
jgi:hypothetical protein